MATIPMFAPNGASGDIPQEQVQNAVKAGFTPAVEMTSPDGKIGYIPANKAFDAQNAGFKVASGAKITGVNPAGQPIFGTDEQPSKLDLYKQALFNPVGSGAAQQGVAGGLEQAGGRAMQTMLSPVLHPIDTAAGIYQLVRHPLDTAGARIQEFRNEWQQDPALALENAVGDVAGAIEGGRVGGAAARPLTDLAGKAVGRAVLLGKTPEGAYESALKIPPSVASDTRATAVQAGLQNAIPVSKAGLDKLGDLIDDLDAKKAAIIQANPGRTVDPYAVAQRTADTSQRFANQVVSQPDLQAIQGVRNQFLAEQGQTPLTPAQPIEAARAQAMKSGTYNVLRGKYGEQGSAVVEAQKSLARGLKEEIATQFPEIANLNASESKLLDLQPVLERAVNRIGNHQAIGIGTPIAAGATKAVTGSSGAAAVIGTLKGVLDNPLVKSRLAIAVSKGGNMTYPAALAKVGAYASSLQSGLDASQANSTAGTPSQ